MLLCRRPLLIVGLFLTIPRLSAVANEPVRPPRVDAQGDPLPSGAILRLGTVRFRHGKSVTCVAYGPDGKTIASASQDTTIRLWEAATGKEVRVLQGHTAEVTCVAFAPDGKTLASVSKDNTIRFWEAAKAKEVRQIKELPDSTFNRVSAVVFTPDGKTVAASGGDDWVGLWEVATGKKVRMLAQPRQQSDYIVDYASSLGFSGDGKVLAAGGKSIRVWEVATGKKLHQFAGADYGSRLAVSRDGTLLAAKGLDSRVQLWQLPAGKKLRSLKSTEMGFALAFAPDGKTLAEGGSAGITLWDVAGGKKLRRLVDYENGVGCLTFAPDGRTLAAGSSDNSVHVWDVATGKELGPAVPQTDVVFALAFAPRGKALAVASQKTIYLHGPGDGLRRFAEQDDGVSCLVFAPDEKTLASGGGDGTVSLWDVATGKELHHLIDHDEMITSLFFSPDGKTVIAGSQDHTLRFWDVATGKELRQLSTAKAKGAQAGFGQRTVPAIAFAPDGKVLAVGGTQGAIRLLDAATGKELRQIQKEAKEGENRSDVVSVAFSPDGKVLAAGSQDRTIRLWDLATNQPIREWQIPATLEDVAAKMNALEDGRQSDLFMVAFSADGKTLASWNLDRTLRFASSWPGSGRKPDGTVRLWETATGKERWQIKDHRGGIACLGFSADGKTLATGSEDTTVLLWNVLGPQSQAPPKLTPRDLEGLWNELSQVEAAKALQAVSGLAAASAQAVAFLRERLEPALPVDPKRLDSLVADLDSQQFAARKRARLELEKLGERAGTTLRKALQGNPSLDARQELEKLVTRLDKARQVLPPEDLQVLRALEVLEQIGTPEARQALEKMARGMPEAWQTREARASLDRLQKRAAPKP
jgi:WD40 repeat protein